MIKRLREVKETKGLNRKVVYHFKIQKNRTKKCIELPYYFFKMQCIKSKFWKYSTFFCLSRHFRWVSKTTLKFGEPKIMKNKLKWLISCSKAIFYLLKCALQNKSLMAHYNAGNIFVGLFLATRGQSCLEPPGFETLTLRFPAWSHDHSATATPLKI